VTDFEHPTSRPDPVSQPGPNRLRFDISATSVSTDGTARAGTVTTSRGSFQTPVFMPVGTRGVVRALGPDDLELLGAQIILGNTYHLMMRPGTDLVEEMGGLHKFADWSGHMLTDSGGYQVFSLDPKVDDDGVTFKSVYDGSMHRFTPERAVFVQEQIGADISMVLDVCAALPSTPTILRQALERTAEWAQRCANARTREDQCLFGIAQGGTDLALRKESAQRTVAIGFDGYAIGGLSVGESRDEMLPSIQAAVSELPRDRPRYLMGVGDPISLIEGVARGIDMFDCVLPTRLARHGTALTSTGKIAIKNAVHAKSEEPIDADCPCMTCQRFSRGYLRHLIAVGEQSAARFMSIHNLSYLLRLMRSARVAIEDGTFQTLRQQTLTIWDQPAV
jgi:queuine tRNA-ribosyltransferase